MRRATVATVVVPMHNRLSVFGAFWAVAALAGIAALAGYRGAWGVLVFTGAAVSMMTIQGRRNTHHHVTKPDGVHGAPESDLDE